MFDSQNFLNKHIVGNLILGYSWIGYISNKIFYIEQPQSCANNRLLSNRPTIRPDSIDFQLQMTKFKSPTKKAILNA